MNKDSTIKHFTDLDVWKEGHRLLLLLYGVTKDFPREEIFVLVSQMRRCVVSITSNIAEGFAKESYKDKVKFYYIARGSAIELENQLLICRDVGYITEDDYRELVGQLGRTLSILNGLIKKSKTFI